MDVPIVRRKPWGIICLILNVFLPGTGTLVAAGNNESIKHFVFGLIQFLTALILVGYVWSLIWGVMIMIKSQ